MSDNVTPNEGPPGPPDDPRRAMAKLDFELGLSLRTIGAKLGVTHTTVGQWAKEGGWVKGAKPQTPRAATPVLKAAERRVGHLTVVQGGADMPQVANLPHVEGGSVEGGNPGGNQTAPGHAPAGAEPEVLAPDMVTMFRERVRQLLTDPTPDEAADVAARAAVEVIRSHRKGIVRANAVAENLLGQLVIAAENRDLLEDFIIGETEPGKYRSMLMRLVQLPAHAGTLKDLVSSLQKLHAMERSAFGLGMTDDPTPPPAVPQAETVATDRFDAVRKRVRERMALVTGPKTVEG